MKKVFGSYLLVLIFLVSCLNEKKCSTDTIFNFNVLASKSFQANVPFYDFGLMSEWEKCVLSEMISSHLNELNNWELTIIDSFYVRNYSLVDLGTNFSFVATKDGKFYFIYVPLLYSYQWDKQFYKRDFKSGLLELKDSASLVISKVNSPMIDDFLNSEVFNSDNMETQYLKSKRVLGAIFPELLKNEVFIPAFLDSLKKEPTNNYRIIMETLDPILSREPILTKSAYDFEAYYLPNLGYIFLSYSKEGYKGLKLEMYFIPRNVRYPILREGENRHRYIKCY